MHLFTVSSMMWFLLLQRKVSSRCKPLLLLLSFYWFLTVLRNSGDGFKSFILALVVRLSLTLKIRLMLLTELFTTTTNTRQYAELMFQEYSNLSARLLTQREDEPKLIKKNCLSTQVGYCNV